MSRIIIIALISSLTLFAGNKDGHIVTQKIAMGFNSQIPNTYTNEPANLIQYFVPEEWSKQIVDKEVKQAWDYFLRDPSKPGMIRLLIHPKDKISSKKVEETLKKYNLPSEPSQFQVPLMQTESRSLYPVTVQENTIPASPRLSMSEGFGKWNGQELDVDSFGNYFGTEYNKMISVKQAEFAIYASRLIQKRLNGTKGSYFEIQPDKMVLAVKSPDGVVNMGETFRDISSVLRDGVYSVPGFANQNLRGGLLIALANGTTDVVDYLKNVEAKIRGNALAEFFALTGFVHSSPHSQNFLVETDLNFKVTGKLRIRDLADLIPTYDSRQSDPKMANLFDQFEDARQALHKNLDGGTEHFAFRHSFFKGNDNLGHISAENRIEIEKAVADSFVNTLSAISGVSKDRIVSIMSSNFSNVHGDYGATYFKRDSDVWNEVLAGIESYRKSVHSESKKLILTLDLKQKLFPQDEKLNDFVKQIIAQTIKGHPLSDPQLDYLLQLWKNRKHIPTNELNNLIAVMITTKAIPKKEIGNFYESIQDKRLKELFFETIALAKSDDARIDFLRYITKRFKNSKGNEDYFSKAALDPFVTNLIYKYEQNPSTSIALFEAMYFAKNTLSGISNKITVALSFHTMAKNIGHIPKSVQNDLTTWQIETKDSSWTVDTLVKTKVYVDPNKCIPFYHFNY